MSEISLAEAEGKLADLVERARQGETIEITQGGKPVARLAPAAPALEPAREPIDIERLRALTASLTPDAEPVETWIRKFRDDTRY
jgi:prevent-host-death family protein